jgi:flagellin
MVGSFFSGSISSDSLVRVLSGASEKAKASMVKLASGRRINSAADDAAGLAVASSLTSQATTLNRSTYNINDGISAGQIADQATSSIGSMATRIAELGAQAANGTLSDSQRASIQQEINGLTEEINRTVQTTEFNGQKLLDGSSLSIQVGSESLALSTSGQSGSVADAVAGLGTVDVSTQASAQAALGQVQQFVASVASSQGAIGASMTRLESAQSTVAIQRETAVAAASRITDVDVAEEASNFLSSQARQQVNVAVLAQANQLPSMALKLLQK